jgi:thioredoxin-dependent peroxiredoxin
MTEEKSTMTGKAPAFSLPNQDGKKVALKDLHGHWVVLYFYPKDDTPGCTTQACEFTTNWDKFQKLSARVIGVSPDSAESHQAFIAKFKLKIDLLSDLDHAVMLKYGAWGEKNNYGKISEGVLRTTVLIDPQGQIAHYWPKVKAAGHAEVVAEKLAELQKAAA